MKSRVPKVLHRVCGREMVSLVVDSAKDAGHETIAVVVSPDSQAIRDVLGDSVSYAVQREQLGSGHALLQAREILPHADNITLLYGDVPLVRSETLESMEKRHLRSQACITLLTAIVEDADGRGRIVRDSEGCIARIVEESDTDEVTLAIQEVNVGIYCFRSSWLWPHLESLPPSRSGEIYLTDLVSEAHREGRTIDSMQSQDTKEFMGVNTRVQLSQVEDELRERIRRHWMLSGVTMSEPSSVYIDLDVQLGQDTMILPNTHVVGTTLIGRECEIGPNTIVRESDIGNECRIFASVIEGSILEDGVEVGPFSHVRPGSHMEEDVHLGNFAEVKNSRLGRGTKSGHFSYIGDAEIGTNVNIGAGTVTVNFDGVDKHVTHIGDDSFIGCDSMLIAPVTIGARSKTSAGAIVTRDVPDDSIAVGTPARVRSKKEERVR